MFLLIVLPLAGVWYYRQTRPRYTPPLPRKEITITVIPGWNLRQIANDWTKKGLIKKPEELYAAVGEAADVGAHMVAFTETDPQFYLFADKPKKVSYEGYFFPETYRVYADAALPEVLEKVFGELVKNITPEMEAKMKADRRSFFEILTMASIVEKEAGNEADMAKVADIFWRRYEKNWALQSCATVNYLTGKNDPGVSAADKKIDSLYNTYKYPGLPPGPISNPGLAAIRAAIFPEPNDFWYFMSGPDGVTHYARTLDEHNYNVAKYLR